MKKSKGRNNGLLPNSLRIISSCLKTVSSNASTVATTVRSAGASVAASISSSSEDHKDQVTWAGFDRLELGPTIFKRVLLLGYQNGFQVLDVEDASNFTELVSKRDSPVTFLQLQPFPVDCNGPQGFRASHPLLLVVSGENGKSPNPVHNQDGYTESDSGQFVHSPTAVQFYSLKTHCYVHVLRFRSAVCMVRCSPRVVAVGLAAQIYCFDAVTLEIKFSVLTYPVPQLAGQGPIGVNFGYGPMAVGPRWLAYASNSPLTSNTGRLSPQNLTSPGVSPSTSPGGSSMMARYAMESSRHLAAGIMNLGDMGYKTLSKYCQELLPDGSNSPVSSNSGWKVGRATASESDNAGMVVIKDFVSRVVISQFKAHTSPISALCFDPSGTLLVTASVYGNTINVFRIMPSCTRGGSDSQTYSSSSAHVHLYRLHRGITSAIIQDICFSPYSQWVGIVSSKGTCHVFVLSPFGGDPGFHNHSSQNEEASAFSVHSIPWWSNSSFLSNQQCFPPPPPVTLSVVSRIKYNDSGWLTTVSNAAASATGKVFVPSGAVAAVFHNSMSRSLQHASSRTSPLEHLLVYTPSGHVIQHKLLPSLGVETGDAVSKARPGSFLQIQEDELRVKVEPVQWWDVCRRLDWPERDECSISVTAEKQDAVMLSVNVVDNGSNGGVDFPDMNRIVVGKKTLKGGIAKSHERSHWYLSNAEVQVSSGRMPVWHKSEICLHTMGSLSISTHVDGELEIEKLPIHEIEIKRKELLPVFDHFHSIKSSWNDRASAIGRYSSFASSDLQQIKLKPAEETVICHSKPASLSSTESSDGGSSRRIENLPDLDQVNSEKHYLLSCQSMDEFYQERRENCFVEPSILKESSSVLLAAESVRKSKEHMDEYCAHLEPFLKNNLLSMEKKTSDGPLSATSNSIILGEVSAPSTASLSSANDILKEAAIPATTNGHVDFGQLFKEGYCEGLELDGCHGLTEVVSDDVDGSSHHEKDKLADGEEDEMLGGVFAFSEDG